MGSYRSEVQDTDRRGSPGRVIFEMEGSQRRTRARDQRQQEPRDELARLYSCPCGFRTSTKRSFRGHQPHCESFRPRNRVTRLMSESQVQPPPYESHEAVNSTRSVAQDCLEEDLVDANLNEDAQEQFEGHEGVLTIVDEPAVSGQPWDVDASDDDLFEVQVVRHIPQQAPPPDSEENKITDQQVENLDQSQCDVNTVENLSAGADRHRSVGVFGDDDIKLLKFAELVLCNRLSSGCVDHVLSWMDKCAVSPLPACAKTLWRRVETLCAREQAILTTHAILKSGVPGFSEVKFFYTNPREAIVRLLLNSRVTFEDELLLDFDNIAHAEGRLSELNTGQWWQIAEAEVRSKFGGSTKLLPLIFAVDGSKVSLKKSVKPVYLSLGVHKYKHRTNVMARECIAFMPGDSAETQAHKRQSSKKAFVHRLLDLKAWNVLLDALDLERPLDITFPSGRVIRFGLSVAYWITDHPEAQNLALVKWQSKTSHPCRFCLTPSDELSNLSLDPPCRNDLVFQRVMDGEEELEYSFYTEPETFNERIKIQGNLGACWSLPLCVLHVFLSQGLVKYVIEWFLEAICENGWSLHVQATTADIQERRKRAGKNTNKGTREKRGPYAHKLKELDERFAAIQSFSERKPDGSLSYMVRFDPGISSLSFLTGRDYLCMIQQLPLLVAESEEKFVPPYALDKFLKLFYDLHRMLFLILKTREWTEAVQVEFEDLARDFTTELTSDRSFVLFFNGKSEMNFSKVHMLRHICELVQFYGTPLNWEAGREEAAHSVFAHSAYKRTNRGDTTEKQMLLWATKFKEVHSLLARHAPTETRESQDMRSKKYPFFLNRRDCPGVKLHQYVRYGMASYLMHWLPRLPISQEQKELFAEYIASGTLPIEISLSTTLPGSRDVIVASSDYKGRGYERYDFVELRPAGSERAFGKVRAIVHAMGFQFFILQHLRPNVVDFARTNGVHPPSKYLQLMHKEDRNEQDGTLWSIYEVSSSVMGKRHIVPIPDKPGKYFLNEMVML